MEAGREEERASSLIICKYINTCTYTCTANTKTKTEISAQKQNCLNLIMV